MIPEIFPSGRDSANYDSDGLFSVRIFRLISMKTVSITATLFVAGLLFSAFGCEQAAQSPTANALAHEDLDAAAWIHTSAEYQAITTAVYRAAEEKLALALADDQWSALPAQQDQFNNAGVADLPPAVILDVDETVLNNNAFQARMIENGTEYSVERWNLWVDEASASLVAGAKEYLEACERLGIEVLFVTNRTVDIERETRRNLERLGALTPDDEDWILSKYGRDGWTTDKSTRRAYIAKHFRVLMVIGDDLNDFVWAGDKPTATQRRAKAAAFEQWWGHKWFLLPNPNYGGWERALYAFDDDLPRSDKLVQKRAALPVATSGQPADAKP